MHAHPAPAGQRGQKPLFGQPERTSIRLDRLLIDGGGPLADRLPLPGKLARHAPDEHLAIAAVDPDGHRPVADRAEPAVQRIAFGRGRRKHPPVGAFQGKVGRPLAQGGGKIAEPLAWHAGDKRQTVDPRRGGRGEGDAWVEKGRLGRARQGQAPPAD